MTVRVDAAASKVLARLLLAGIAAGCLLLASGALVCALDGGLVSGIGLGQTGFAVHGLYELDGPALLRAGILVLILTPIVRVAAVAALLAQRDDRSGVVWAVGVLLLLTLATVLELRH